MLLAVLLLAPVLTRGPILVGVASESAYVVWQTSERQANGTVRIGSAPGNYPGSAQDASYTETHHVQLTGLLPATTYHYAIDSDPQAQDSTFTTANSVKRLFVSRSTSEKVPITGCLGPRAQAQAPKQPRWKVVPSNSR